MCAARPSSETSLYVDGDDPGAQVDLVARGRVVGVRNLVAVLVEDLQDGVVVTGGADSNLRRAHHRHIVGVLGIERRDQRSRTYGQPAQQDVAERQSDLFEIVVRPRPAFPLGRTRSAGSPIATVAASRRGRPVGTGTCPDNRLPERSSRRRPARSPREVGIGPDNRFPWRDSSCRLGRLPSSTGIGPVNRFCESTSHRSSVRLPTSGGYRAGQPVLGKVQPHDALRFPGDGHAIPVCDGSTRRPIQPRAPRQGLPRRQQRVAVGHQPRIAGRVGHSGPRGAGVGPYSVTAYRSRSWTRGRRSSLCPHALERRTPRRRPARRSCTRGRPPWRRSRRPPTNVQLESSVSSTTVRTYRRS